VLGAILLFENDVLPALSQALEITAVLRGMVQVEHESRFLEVQAGQAVFTSPGESVRYSTPGPDGAEYVAVCLPAFSPATVHRDE